MYIHWLGESSFTIKCNETAIIIDPAHKQTGLSQSKIEGDIILISGSLATDISRVAPTKNNTGTPLCISSPGEYEHRGVFVYGLPSGNNTTLYLIKVDDIDIAHLGGLGEPLTDRQLELFEGSNIGFVPVGDKGVLNAQEADEVISQIEPQIVIPMNYHIPKLTVMRNPVDGFLAEIGAQETAPESYLSITKSKLPDDKMRIVLLQP